MITVGSVTRAEHESETPAPRRIRLAQRPPVDAISDTSEVDTAGARINKAGDPYGERRIDAIRVTEEIVPALQNHTVIDTGLTRSASDHLPMMTGYDPSQISQQAGSAV